MAQSVDESRQWWRGRERERLLTRSPDSCLLLTSSPSLCRNAAESPGSHDSFHSWTCNQILLWSIYFLCTSLLSDSVCNYYRFPSQGSVRTGLITPNQTSTNLSGTVIRELIQEHAAVLMSRWWLRTTLGSSNPRICQRSCLRFYIVIVIFVFFSQWMAQKSPSIIYFWWLQLSESLLKHALNLNSTLVLCDVTKGHLSEVGFNKASRDFVPPAGCLVFVPSQTCGSYQTVWACAILQGEGTQMEEILLFWGDFCRFWMVIVT